MNVVKFDDAERHEPEPGWMRVALAGSDRFSVEWFEKPPGHSSPMHHHENEQVCVCLDGRLVVQFDDERVELGPYDSVWIGANEPHRVGNDGEATAVGLDIFAPGRSFDFWTDRETDDE
jgi:quercetin dioxygenase-like cupin family protein